MKTNQVKQLNKVVAQLRIAGSKLQLLLAEADAAYTKRSTAWQRSELGKLLGEEIDLINEAIDKCDDLRAHLGKIEGVSKEEL